MDISARTERRTSRAVEIGGADGHGSLRLRSVRAVFRSRLSEGDDYTAEASTRRGPEFWRDAAYSIRHTPRRYSLLTLVSENGKVSCVTCVRSTARRKTRSSGLSRSRFGRYEASVCGLASVQSIAAERLSKSSASVTSATPLGEIFTASNRPVVVSH